MLTVKVYADDDDTRAEAIEQAEALAEMWGLGIYLVHRGETLSIEPKT